MIGEYSDGVAAVQAASVFLVFKVAQSTAVCFRSVEPDGMVPPACKFA
jgi:hypothetical protein